MSAGWVLHGILYGLSQAQLLSSGPPPSPWGDSLFQGLSWDGWAGWSLNIQQDSLGLFR